MRLAYPGLKHIQRCICSRKRLSTSTLRRGDLSPSTHTPSVHSQWFTEKEQAQAALIKAAKAKYQEYIGLTSTNSDKPDIEIQTAKKLKELAPFAEIWSKYSTAREAIAVIQPHLKDSDDSLRNLFEDEHRELCDNLDHLVSVQIPEILLSAPDTDALPAVISVNSGVGGAEANLFVEDLVRMYTRYAEQHGWKTETISQTEGTGSKGGNGLKDLTMKLEGDGSQPVYGRMKWERGVHRVQRVPQTESLGRVHTSTAAVVVMPLYPDTGDEPLVSQKDVKTEVMRSRGAGGQHVNKTESAVRLTHIPTGISVSMQDSRSQHQNRAWAWEILRARLSERKHAEAIESRRNSRRTQVKAADRSEKIRTYNFPQDRLTDHRVGFSLTGLQNILDGTDLQLVHQALDDDLTSRRLHSIIAGEEDIDE